MERRLGHPSRAIAGVDEVGRGCLAGPVVAGAVILPEDVSLKSHRWLLEVADSKLLLAEVRERLEPLIRSWARAVGIGVASVAEIDRLNIHHASHLAMLRAVEALGIPPAHVLVDGKFSPRGFSCEVTAVVKADQKCLSVACASIVAKVWRDRHLAELDRLYPGYGLAEHKGYHTPAHIQALDALGVAEIHRRSFGPVAARLSAGARLPEEPAPSDIGPP